MKKQLNRKKKCKGMKTSSGKRISLDSMQYNFGRKEKQEIKD